MDELAPLFRAEAVCAVTGWNGGLLRTRRTRNGLFPDTKQSGDTTKWTKFSFVDLCQARTVAKLDNMGFGPDDAVGISNHIRSAYVMMAKRNSFSSIAVVRYGLPNSALVQSIHWAEPVDTLSTLTDDEVDLEAAVIIDCAQIYCSVRRIVNAGSFIKEPV